MKNGLSLSLALALAAAVSASPAMAQQGKAKHNGNGNRARTEVRDERRRDDDRRGDLRLDRRTTSRRVPPGWCIGRGNPHNTVENCGPGRDRYDRRYDPRYNGTYDPRYDSRSGSYSQRHADYHSWHDRQCRDLAAQRPLDLSYQMRVRAQCQVEHQEWHRREGISH